MYVSKTIEHNIEGHEANLCVADGLLSILFYGYPENNVYRSPFKALINMHRKEDILCI